MCPFGVLKAQISEIHHAVRNILKPKGQLPDVLAEEKGNTPPTETKCASNDPLKLCCLYGQKLGKSKRRSVEDCRDSSRDGSEALERVKSMAPMDPMPS